MELLKPLEVDDKWLKDFFREAEAGNTEVPTSDRRYFTSSIQPTDKYGSYTTPQEYHLKSRTTSGLLTHFHVSDDYWNLFKDAIHDPNIIGILSSKRRTRPDNSYLSLAYNAAPYVYNGRRVMVYGIDEKQAEQVQYIMNVLGCKESVYQPITEKEIPNADATFDCYGLTIGVHRMTVIDDLIKKGKWKSPGYLFYKKEQ